MYHVWIYFLGPESNWSGKISAREIIAHYPSPWLWLAKLKAGIAIRDLNQGRCGAVVMHGEKEMHHIYPLHGIGDAA